MKKDKSDHSFLKKFTMNMDAVKVDLWRAAVGGFFAAIVVLIGGLVIGSASGWEAFEMIKTTLPATLAFCETLVLALGNILALMLTLLSLSASMDIDIEWSHYQRIQQISWIVTITLITTVVAYLLMNIPIIESDSTSSQWFAYIYYATLVISSILGGAFITIALLLYNTVRDMIGLLNPEGSHVLQNKEQEEE